MRQASGFQDTWASSSAQGFRARLGCTWWGCGGGGRGVAARPRSPRRAPLPDSSGCVPQMLLPRGPRITLFLLRSEDPSGLDTFFPAFGGCVFSLAGTRASGQAPRHRLPLPWAASPCCVF